jgi:non-homologous end joining protein Ku
MAYRIVNVQLGPITFDAGMDSAVRDEDAGLVSLCTHAGRASAVKDPSRIKRKDYCPDCENESKETFVKGRQMVTGKYEIVDVSALETLAPTVAQKKTVPLTVHPAAQLSSLFFSGKTYYLTPRGATASTYTLLATLMRKRPDLGFVGEFSFGGAPALYQVLEDRGVLVMRQVARPETVQVAPKVEPDEDPAWLELAEKAAEAVCVPYDPAQYRDRRAELLAGILQDAPTSAAGDLEATLLAFVAKHSAKAAAKAPRQRTKTTAAKKTAAKKTAKIAS